jgi:hypothetical protein
MRTLIIDASTAAKLRNTDFGPWDALNPVKGELNGVEVYFLQESLKTNPTFAKALTDFEACKVKEIDTFEHKFFDPITDEEILPTVVPASSKKKMVLDGGKQTEVNVVEPETRKYLNSNGDEIADIFSMKSKTILTEKV